MNYRQELSEVHKKIKKHIHRTPVLSSKLLNDLCGASLHFKCENLQRMGAFKIRGATNAILNLSREQKKNGVVTHSSGNFAQALSLAAKSLQVPAYIVMPSNAPEVKKAAVRQYGGKITECAPRLSDREATAASIVKNKKANFVHPSNDNSVILGQATAAMELFEDKPDLDYLLTPVGGGGLIAGSALAANYFSAHCKTIGAEPLQADDAYRSLLSGKIESNKSTNTIADGLKTQLGDKNFPIIKKHVSRIIRIEENEIITAMQLIWERMKLVVEASSALPLAAVLKEKNNFAEKKIGIILSGGNVDLKKLPF